MAEVNNLLKNNNIYENQGLTLIPYGVTNRGTFHEDHSVLIAIYAEKIYIIDPKNKSDYQINVAPYKTVSTNMQKWYDRTNCGRYTAHIAIRLANKFLDHANDHEFNMIEQIKTIDVPKLADLQEIFLEKINKDESGWLPI